MKKTNAKALICATLGNIIWGFGFLFTKVGLEEAPSSSVMLSHRFVLSVAVMAILMPILKEKISFKGKNWKPLALLLLTQICYYMFESYAIMYTNSTVSGLVLSVVPVVTIATGALFLKEYPTKRQALFCLLPVAGVIMISVTGGELGFSKPVLGGIFLVLTLLISALYKTANRKSAAQFSAFERTFLMLAISAVFFTATGLQSVDWKVSDFFAPLLNTRYLGAVLALGLLSSIGANMLVNYAAGQMSAFALSSFGSLSTLCAAVAGIVFLKEPVNITLVLGGILILVGVRQITKPKT